jgi:hypothetical protein
MHALLLLALALGDVRPPGAHAQHKALFEGHPLWLPATPTRPSPQLLTPHLSRRVYGYLPSFSSATVGSLRWDALTDVVIFDATVNGSTGAITPPSRWSAATVTAAHDHGGRAHLCASLFGGVDTFLASAPARTRAIQELVAAVQGAGGDGVNIDFEFVQSGGKVDFVTFITDLASALHAAIPGSEVTIAMPAYPPWDPGYDIPGLGSAADRLLLMEYDWHWSSAPNAGPVAPLTAGGVWGKSDTEGLASYLSATDKHKLALGVPFYGYDWPTVSETALDAATQGRSAVVLYRNAAADAAAHGGRLWDTASQTPWYHYSASSQAHQAWFEDAQSLGLKYDLANQQDLGGIMIWALGYEGSDPAPADLIVSSFGIVATTDAGNPVTDAGLPVDAGSPLDAGAPLDAGVRDAGALLDAGSSEAPSGLGCEALGAAACGLGFYCDPLRHVCRPEPSQAMVRGGCQGEEGLVLLPLGLVVLGLGRRRRAD